MPVTLRPAGLRDSVHHAALASNISAFLMHELCDSIVISAIIPHAAAFLLHLATRIDAYSFQLTAGANLERKHASNTSSTLHIWNVGKAMKDLADYLGMWSYTLMKSQLSYANEASLKKDLENAAKFLGMLCEKVPELWEISSKAEPPLRTGSLRGGGDAGDMLAALQEENAINPEAERQHEAVGALNNAASPPKWTISCPTAPNVVQAYTPKLDKSQIVGEANSIQLHQRRLSTNSDISILVLEPRPTCTILEANLLLPLTRLDSPTPPPSENDLALPSFITSGPSASPVHRLCANKHNTGHASHHLDGPRHMSRCGIPDDQAFTQHCLKHSKWLIDRPVEPQTTAQIGHNDGVAFRCIEADFLGFQGVKAIKIMHPLCPMELVGLDWDVMRAVSFHLRQYVGRKAVCTSHRREIVQRAETTSLEMVEREVETRGGEGKRAANDSSSSERTDGSSDSSEESSMTAFQEDKPDPVQFMKISTPPSRTGRPEFNTRRSEWRTRNMKGRMAHDALYLVSAGEQSDDFPTQSHPDGDSYAPGTVTYYSYE